jgi:hypothetical protein
MTYNPVIGVRIASAVFLVVAHPVACAQNPAVATHVRG